MIKSMTGFGRAESSVDLMTITIEAKSVNHRYFEFNARIPRVYAFLEDRLKNLFQTKISRGKVDVFLTIDTTEKAKTMVEVNYSLAEGYIKALRNLVEEYDIKDDISASTIARMDDVFSIKKEVLDEEIIWNAVFDSASLALDKLVSMKETEGTRLVEDVLSRINLIQRRVEFVEQRSPETVKLYRDKLEQKIKELICDVQVDEQRLLTETAILADKIAVSEETVRLRSHINQLTDLLKDGESVGRKLDFIIQEMNREANTIGSKAQDVEVAKAVVDIKSEIEKIREQIQNIE